MPRDAPPLRSWSLLFEDIFNYLRQQVKAKEAEADALSRYLQLVEEAKETFRSELAAALPETKSEPDWKRTSKILVLGSLSDILLPRTRRFCNCI